MIVKELEFLTVAGSVRPVLSILGAHLSFSHPGLLPSPEQ